jgi:uncharacterized protein
MQIKDRLVLITGASSGIGAATAQALARRGARVILVARTRSALEEVAAGIAALGGEAHIFAADLTNSAEVTQVAQAITDCLGTPDLLVNNAGAGRWLFLEETDPVEAVQMMAAPYFAACFTIRVFLPAMLERRTGMIVNVTSVAGYTAFPGATAYTAARWAMRGFTKALQADLHGSGLHVMLFAPGEVSSSYWDHNPGSRERMPGIARLYPKLTPEQTAEALARAIEHDRHEVILPWLLRMTVLMDRFMPGPIEWLLVKTGTRRK